MGKTRAAGGTVKVGAPPSGGTSAPREGAAPCGGARRGVPRWVLAGLGSLCVGLGTAAVFLPVVPTTPFLLLAVWCYARSSRRLNDWLVANRLLGPCVRPYVTGCGMPLRAKAATLAMLWAALAVSAVFFVSAPWTRAVLGLVGVGVTAHVIMVKTAAPGRGAGGLRVDTRSA